MNSCIVIARLLYDQITQDREITNMLKGQSEIRIIWLMMLIIIAVSAWFFDTKIVSYICGLAFVMSVMQYVDAIQNPMQEIATETRIPLQNTSKVPLYISSIISVVGLTLHFSWLVGLGLTAWIFFFLRWLRRLERYLTQVQIQLKHMQISTDANIYNTVQNKAMTANQSQESPDRLIMQIRQWVFQGNLVLKVAIVVLVIGIVLLLRFATEHWQLSLSIKLTIVALSSGVVTAFGFFLQNKNRSFALALEGLGLAGLFLTLFFAYYNHVIPNIYLASICFAVIMVVTLALSLKQQSVELALMAMLIAYIAPFTLPIRSATATELVAYYLVINIAIAVLSTLRPWKYLNQIGFLVTSIIGGGYAFYHGYIQEKMSLTILIIAHVAVFVWLGFRFSQLIAKQDLEQFKLKPSLDIALIFGAPIIGFLYLYLMYFHQEWQLASFSLAFALVFSVIYQLSKKNQSIQLISQSYFSLALIFIALIPPILLHDEWSVVGWAVEGLFIFGFALYKHSAISRYMAIALLIVAGCSSLYYLFESTSFPGEMYWYLSISYVAVVILANCRVDFQKQISMVTTVFLSGLMISATTMLLALLLEYFDEKNQYIYCLGILSLMYFALNELLIVRKASWSWLITKWIGVIPLYVFALILLLDVSERGQLIWENSTERWGLMISGLILSWLWVRPMRGLQQEQEWVSLGGIASLCLASLSFIPSMPYISIVILPLLFCGWCFFQKNSDWTKFWQTRSSLVLMLIWIMCSQLFSQQAFQTYVLPILNPFDVMSIAILIGFLWMLNLQLKQQGMDQGVLAVLSVLSVLWLSSYILLRALHVYFSTPYNSLALWQDAFVQLSLTMLWVSLAFVAMSYASRKFLRPLWVLGGSILVIVTLKLVLFDLSHIGTLTRVVSFLGAGFVMLVIAYIAPIPEQNSVQRNNLS